MLIGRAKIRADDHIAIKQRHLLQVASLTLVKGKAITISRSTARPRIVKIEARKPTLLIESPAITLCQHLETINNRNKCIFQACG